MSSIPEQIPEISVAKPVSPPYSLFDSSAVALATFFGTPVAGATLMFVSDRRSGREGRGVTTLLAAIALTALIIWLGWKLSPIFSAVITVALVVAMQRIASWLQGAVIQDHLSRGGRLGSRWAAFGVGMAYLAAMFVVVFLLIFLPAYKANNGPKVVVGSKDEVYYSGSATQSDAQALGNALKSAGYFADTGATVLLNKGQSGATVSFVVKDGIWDKPEMVSSFEEMGREVALSVGGFPIQVRLLNKDRNVQKESTVGKFSAGNDHVYFLGAATETQAQALAEELTSAGFFQGKGSDVFLSRQSDGTTLSFVVGDGSWDDPALVSSFEKTARGAAPAIGGLPIRLHLESTSLEVKKDEPLD